MKKTIKKLLTALLATTAAATVISFAGCGDTDEKPSGPPAHTEHIDENGDGICDIGGEPMPESPPEDDEYLISVTGLATREIGVGESAQIEWTVLKNGSAVTGEGVTVTFNNQNVSFDEDTDTVTGVTKGTSVATLTLDRDSTVTARITFAVREYFFNHEIDRGTWDSVHEDDTDPYISIVSGQASVLVKQASTKYVFKFKTSMNARDIESNRSFGAAAFLIASGKNAGDNALWFGLKGTDARGEFSLYQKQFFNGWGTGDESVPAGYNKLATGFEDVEFVIIRDGLDYYCSINGYYSKYTVSDAAHADIPTYAGIYSQDLAFDVYDYEYSSEQTAVDQAIADYYTNRGAAAIAINETYLNEIVKGRSETYTAGIYPSDKAEGVTVMWSLDKTEMTAGADGTSVDQNGTVTLAADAAGFVTLICSADVDADKTISQRLRIEILPEDLLASNDYITCKGGVALNDGDTDDWSITFPESRMSRCGISQLGSGSEQDKYTETRYSAVLKANVKSNFQLEFKFSDYKSNKSAPKLQVSLGADKNNFYLVYGTDNRFRIESFTQGTTASGVTTSGWYSTEWMDLDRNAEHTFKLTVGEHGVYTVYIDGTARPFYKFDDATGSGERVSIVRQYVNFTRSLPIKLATDGCSATLSDITVTNGTDEALNNNFYAENQSYSIAADGFTIVNSFTPNSDGWQFGGWNDYRIYYMKTLDTQGYAMNMKVDFGAVMTDAKTVMRVGDPNGAGYELQFTNKPAGVGVTLRRGSSWNNGTVKIDEDEPLSLDVRLEAAGGKLRVIVNGKTVFNEDYAESNITSAAEFYFYQFNNTASEAWSTASPEMYTRITNFSVEAHGFAAQDVYELKNNGATSIDIMYAYDKAPKTLSVDILKNGAVMAAGDGYSVEFVMESDDKAHFDQTELANGVIKVVDLTELKNITATVYANLMKNGAVVDTIAYTVTVINKATENAAVTTKGGVMLNYGTDPDVDWSLTFPESKIGENGVGNDAAYQDNAYSADFKTKVKGDFSIEFTVKNYKSRGDFPKLMISLGGSNNQFYVVYNRLGTIHHMETFVNASSTGGHGAGGWISSDVFTGADNAAFDTAADHTFKIEVRNGIYHAYIDGTELRFSFDSDNDHSTATLYRNIVDYEKELPVRMSTNGVSATVSNIVITDLNEGEVDLPDFYSYNPDYGNMTNTGFTIALSSASIKNNHSDNESWARDSMYHKVTYLQPINTDTQMAFDIDFPTGMKDGKLVMKLGNWEYHFMDKRADNGKRYFQLYPGGWDEPSVEIENSGALHVVFERKDGRVWTYVNGKRVLNGKQNADTSTRLEFYIFGVGEDVGRTATVSSFTEKQYDEATRYMYYEIGTAQSTLGIKPGDAATAVQYSVKCNDVAITELPEGVTVEYSLSESEYIKLDADNKVYAEGTFTGAQTATLTITLKKDGAAIGSTSVAVTATALATENAVLSVSGGATLNYATDPDEDGWSVTFPEAMRTTNGVVNEENYAEANYSANFKGTFIGDYAVEFTVSDYYTEAEYPKLMISLGGSNNQFYVVVKNGQMRMETFTRSLGGNLYNGGQWVCSEWVAYDGAQSHKFKIEIVGGYYKAYHDDVEFTQFKMDNDARTPVRNAADYIQSLPIRMSTNGVRATVTGIKVTGGQTAPTKTFTSYDSGKNNITGGTFTENYYWGYDGRGMAPDNLGKAIRTVQYFTNGQTAKFDLTFNSKMSDSKFGVIVSNFKNDWNNEIVWIENKLTGSDKSIKIQKNWGNDVNLVAADAVSSLTTITLHIQLVRNNNALSAVITGDGIANAITWTHPSYNSSDIAFLYFYGFNGSACEDTFTISDFSIVNN